LPYTVYYKNTIEEFSTYDFIDRRFVPAKFNEFEEVVVCCQGKLMDAGLDHSLKKKCTIVLFSNSHQQ
jgi:hypothetical protein